jgi:hypothetical protein
VTTPSKAKEDLDTNPPKRFYSKDLQTTEDQMAQSDKVKSAIKAAIQAIEERSAFQRKLQREVLTYGTRTRKVGNAFRQKIFNKAFAAGRRKFVGH